MVRHGVHVPWGLVDFVRSAFSARGGGREARCGFDRGGRRLHTHVMPPPLPVPGPVRPEERRLGWDAVRGLALLGILLINMNDFRSPD